MKRLFSSVVSIAVSAVCMLSGEFYADAINMSYSVYEGDFEEFTYDEAEEFELTIPQSPAIQSNFSDGSYNYVDFLDENNLAVYNALSVWTTPSEEAVTISLPKTISVSLSGLPGTSSYTEEDAENLKSAIFSSCKSGIDSLFFDMPEIFWLDTGNLAIGVGNATQSYSYINKKYTLKISTLKITPSVFDSLGSIENAILYKEKLETAVDNFKVEGDTRYEMLQSIHDTIALFTYYDTSASYASSAIGSLVEPGVVCEGYSKGFKLICDKLGIPCVLIFGNYDVEQNVAHMWNYVQMEDGKWYAVDVTWDDTDGVNGREFKYEYFLNGSDNFFLKHTEESDFAGTILNYPELSASDYSVQQSGTETTTTTTETTESTTTTTTTETTESTTTTTTTETTESTTTTTTTETTESTTTTTTTETTESTTTTTTTEATESTTTTTTTEATESTTTTTTTETTESTTTTTTTEATESTTTITTTDTIESTTEAVAEPEFLHGDYNLDGKVNVADMVICAENLIGKQKNCFCDFNEDSLFDVFDLLAMRKYMVEKTV